MKNDPFGLDEVSKIGNPFKAKAPKMPPPTGPRLAPRAGVLPTGPPKPKPNAGIVGAMRGASGPGGMPKPRAAAGAGSAGMSSNLVAGGRVAGPRNSAVGQMKNKANNAIGTAGVAAMAGGQKFQSSSAGKYIKNNPLKSTGIAAGVGGGGMIGGYQYGQHRQMKKQMRGIQKNDPFGLELIEKANPLKWIKAQGAAGHAKAKDLAYGKKVAGEVKGEGWSGAYAGRKGGLLRTEQGEVGGKLKNGDAFYDKTKGKAKKKNIAALGGVGVAGGGAATYGLSKALKKPKTPQVGVYNQGAKLPPEKKRHDPISRTVHWARGPVDRYRVDFADGRPQFIGEHRKGGFLLKEKKHTIIYTPNGAKRIERRGGGTTSEAKLIAAAGAGGGAIEYDRRKRKARKNNESRANAAAGVKKNDSTSAFGIDHTEY